LRSSLFSIVHYLQQEDARHFRETKSRHSAVQINDAQLQAKGSHVLGKVRNPPPGEGSGNEEKELHQKEANVFELFET
jgi:hypothetical protein